MSNRELIEELRGRRWVIDEQLNAKLIPFSVALEEAADALEAHEWQPIEAAQDGVMRIWCGKGIDAELDCGTWYIADPSNKGRLTLEFFGTPTHWKPRDQPPEDA